MYLQHVRYLEIASEALAGNPMGNPARRYLAILLPEGFSEERRYPTVWMLDGYLGSGLTMLNHPGALGAPFGEEALEYQRDGLLPPSIFVFPDGSTRLGGSQYLDSAACGAFMTHLVDELVPLVDARLPTVAEAAGRVVAGHSSGGYGALVLPMLRPGVFGSAIASAGDSAFELSLRPDFPRVARALARDGGVQPFLDRLLGAAVHRRLPPDDYHALMTLAMATCYSPAPERPGWCELPFDLETAELNDEVWRQWLRWDPVVLADEHAAALAGLLHLHLDCGSDDEYAAQFGHRQLAGKLSRRGIAHLHTEFPGGHDSTRYRYRYRFELLGEKLAAAL